MHAEPHNIAVITGFLTVTILLSFNEVMTPSSVPNIEPNPNINNIKKNKIAHIGGIGNWMIASVKTTKAKPVPSAA